MYRLKRFPLILFSLILSISFICPAVVAAEKSIQASLYLDSYSGYLTPGDHSGSIDIDYFVEGKGRSSDCIGVSQIVLYRADGSYVTTIHGSTSNGLLARNVGYNSGSYTYYGVSGVTYYAEMTMYAEKDGGSDSKLYITNSVTAP